MKGFILRQVSLLRSLYIPSDAFRVISWLLSLIISAYLLIILSVPLFESSSHKGYIFPNNEDGGRAIELSMATRWYNSNHFAPYGNLYYRLSQTLADLAPLKEDLTNFESLEKSHHFSLKLVSLFSLFGLGLFLGFVLFGSTYVAPLFASFFTLASLSLPMFGKMIFRPHPDHLLNLTIAIAVYMFAKLVSEKNNLRVFILSAFCWGLAMAVKRSTSIFIPGILLLMLFPLSKENFKKTFSYIGYMLLAYLVIGFPQNFGFYAHIKFMLYESSLHSFGDLDSVSHNLKLILNQISYLIPIVLVASIFSINRRKLFSLKIVLLIISAFIPILMRKLAFESDHHTMPLAIAFTVMVMIFILEYLPWRIRSGLAVAILLLIGIKFIGVSKKYTDFKYAQTNCFTDYDQMMSLIEPDISSQHLLVREASFPWNEKIGTFTRASWGLDWSMIDSNVMFFGVTNYSLHQYLNSESPAEMYGKMIVNWENKKQFYTDIANKTVVTSPMGQTYKRVFSSPVCGQHLWKMEK